MVYGAGERDGHSAGSVWRGLPNGWKPDLTERGGPLGLAGSSGDG